MRKRKIFAETTALLFEYRVLYSLFKEIAPFLLLPHRKPQQNIFVATIFNVLNSKSKLSYAANCLLKRRKRYEYICDFSKPRRKL